MNNGIQAGVVDGHMGTGSDPGLRPIGDAQPGNRHHFQIVGSIAHDNGRIRRATQIATNLGHASSLCMRVDNVTLNLPRQFPINDFE
jgi:hypothetical protein